LIVWSNVVRIGRAFGNDHERKSNFAVALDVVHQRFHTRDDQAAFARACDLANPAQSIFQVALGSYVDPSLSWHGKTSVSAFLRKPRGEVAGNIPPNRKFFIDTVATHLG